VSEKVNKITVILRILAFLLLAGLLIQMFIPQKIKVDGDRITIQHLFTSYVNLKDVLGITERTSSKSGSRFYFIDTVKGSYEVDDASFISKEGKQIITNAGFSKMEVSEGNIKNVYCAPKILIDLKKQIQTESINYDFRKIKRARTADQGFSDLYISLLITIISLSLIIPCGYCSLHPENFKDVFPTWVSKEKPISLRSARILSVCLFIMGLALLIFCNGIMFTT
jgi:hypothetical protein